jgi:hypothetical protein
MTEVTASELRDKDPKAFNRDYEDWVAYALDYEWWDCIEEDFRAEHAEKGIEVTRIFFSGFYHQGSHAGFTGDVNIASFMKHTKLDEQYPALYQAVFDDGSYVVVQESGRYGMGFDWRANFDVAPAGVFKDLDEDTYRELVNQQEADADLETYVKEVCEDLAHDLFSALEQECEHLTSEESFIEHCECNDVKFEIEGGDEE